MWRAPASVCLERPDEPKRTALLRERDRRRFGVIRSAAGVLTHPQTGRAPPCTRAGAPPAACAARPDCRAAQRRWGAARAERGMRVGRMVMVHRPTRAFGATTAQRASARVLGSLAGITRARHPASTAALPSRGSLVCAALLPASAACGAARGWCGAWQRPPPCAERAGRRRPTTAAAGRSGADHG